MNIIEAIKSGRPYRRSCWDTDVWRPAMCLLSNTKTAYCERFDDLIADDWEVEEPAVRVTLSQFYAAVADVMKEAELHSYTFGGHHFDRTPQALAKKLGFDV